MEIALPARFEDLTLAHYMAIKTENDPIKLLASVSGLTPTAIRKLPSRVFDRAIAHIHTLAETETAKHQKVLTIDGVEYGFIPDWQEFSTGEWVDMERYTQDLHGNALNIMSLLYRPITRRYRDVYEIAKYTAKEPRTPFAGVRAEIYLGVLLFFSTTKRTHMNFIIQSLAITAEQGTLLAKNGGGTTFSTRWQGVIFSAWKTLQKCRLK